jgi:mannose-6-phosphate isomerase-like protein (cupin superfamily)
MVIKTIDTARAGFAAAALAAIVLQAGPRVAGSGPQVTFIAAGKVDAAFAKGAPLIETAGYKVHASRRDGPGMAEVHVRDTDIVYVLQGTATIVTGGSIVEPKPTATDEIRGPRIAGGEERRLAKGDVMIIPEGVPHWFKEVEAPFTYYVVKATAPAGGMQ